jgi:4-amino-4-deoxy-L-arabinose transferase-like glycosyltransferase
MREPVSPALFDQFARGWRGYVLIALIALVSGLFGAARLPVMDRDEARFAQATRQMLETGDFIRIRNQEDERNKKPIGIHWLQAASVQAFEPLTGRLNAIWPYRLPSALGAMLAALACLWGGRALLKPREAFLGAALFSAGALLGFEGMTAKTDALLVGFTTLAMAALARLYAGSSRPRLLSLLFWFALGCGVLIKGPVTPMVAGLTLIALAAWERRWDWMKPLAWWPGPLLAVAIVLPWMLAIN